MAVALLWANPLYPGVWEDLEGYFADALEKGGGERDWSLDDIREQAETGRVDLWALVEDEEIVGAGVTCRSFYPQRAILEILVFGCQANRDEGVLEQGLQRLKEIARDAGMQALVGTGRPGWIRKLPVSRHRYVWEIDL